MADTYYGTAGRDADDGLAKLLQATKSAGKAGQDAYNTAKTDMDASQAAALKVAGGAEAFIGRGSRTFTDRRNQESARFTTALNVPSRATTRGWLAPPPRASPTSRSSRLRATP